MKGEQLVHSMKSMPVNSIHKSKLRRFPGTIIFLLPGSSFAIFNKFDHNTYLLKHI